LGLGCIFRSRGIGPWGLAVSCRRDACVVLAHARVRACFCVCGRACEFRAEEG
jgi:hypothetical protein